jgi:hypothetical protein
MRPLIKCFLLTAALAGCDSGADTVDRLSGPSGTATFAAAGNLVDQSALIPIPPPGAVCHADGSWTICHTQVSLNPVNEPVFDLPCGTMYETSSDVRHGIRWYNGDGKLAKRFVTQDVEGTWSLSPEGAGPTVKITAHDNWRNVYPVPGDLSSELQVNHGDGLTVRVPGLGVIAHVAGMDRREDEDAPRGIFRDIEDPAVQENLCAALTR